MKDIAAEDDEIRGGKEAARLEMKELAMEYLQDICRRPEGPKKKLDHEIRGEMSVLKYLHETKSEATPSEISDHLRLTTARIANILLSLEKKGLIERKQDLGDRRKVNVCLTEKGLESAEAGRQEALRKIEYMLNYLGEEDARELIRLEHRITELVLELEAKEGKE